MNDNAAPCGTAVPLGRTRDEALNDTQWVLVGLIGAPQPGRYSDWLWRGVEAGLLPREEAEEMYLSWLEKKTR